jgi:amidohydrolase
MRFAATTLLIVGASGVGPVSADVYTDIDQLSDAVEERVIEWRRDFHAHPELSNREFRTAGIVADHLRSLGIEVRTEVAHTGVIGILEGGKPGPVVALRADMDGLPVVERTGLPYASKVKSTYEGQNVGVMHACGHDNHVAILMGAASVLAEIRDQIPGTIKFVFQPAEEGAPRGEEGGAGLMVKEGVLEQPDVDAIFGLHISQNGEVGTAGYRSRGALASAQRFDITVTGRQTHGSQPWAGVDPIIAGAHIVTALQTIVSRRVNITSAPAVVTVATFHGGVRNNIVPDEAKLSGTIRTFDAQMRKDIHEAIHEIATSVGESMGATVEVVIDPGVPVTYNDPDLTAMMVPTLERVYEGRVATTERITGAEDFAFYQEELPGFFFFIGGRPASLPADQAIPNHSPLFYVDEDALLPGVRAMSQLAVDYLNAKSKQ